MFVDKLREKEKDIALAQSVAVERLARKTPD
jgi:hypothetical protein